MSRAERLAAGALALVIPYLVLVQPNHPAALTPGALRVFPLELPVIVAALLALPRRWARRLAHLLTAAMVVMVVQKLADFGSFTAFGRGFNPAVDLHLIPAAWNLASGAVGAALAGLALAAASLALLLLALALDRALLVWARIELPAHGRGAAALCAVAALALATAEAGRAMRLWTLPVDPPGAAFTARIAATRIGDIRESLAEQRDFARLARSDPYADAGPLLDETGGRDVLVIFIESYGRSSHDVPLYAPTHTATLRAAEPALRRAGLAMRSGWLTAPTAGGQSWLSHETLASGLWVTNQVKYGAALHSSRRTLTSVAQAAGFHTGAVMPAITMDWPEGGLMHFDTILAAGDLGYRGKPFSWITMPDQFTLAALDKRLREPVETPVFAEVALVSSHAPWVPVPELVPWDEVGDGRIFDRWAEAGDPPEVVWKDRDRIRAQYRKAIDYSLRTVMSYAARQGGPEAPLMVVLGDHPAAGFVAQSESGDVPVHMIGPPGLLARVESWGWAEGLLPGPETPVWRMDAFRDRFLAAFSSGAPAVQAAR